MGEKVANVSAERDLDRAKQLRAMRKGVRSASASRTIEEAASRLEARAARKLSKLGRRKKKATVEGGGGLI